LNTADEAAKILEKAIADMPGDVELISILAQTYIDAKDAAGAERATGLLLKEDASNYRAYIEVARLYLKLGQEDECARVLGSIIEQMLAGREENDLLELVEELLARNPAHVPGLRLLARIHWWQRDMDKLRVVLERLAEAAQAAGLAEEERYALTQLVRLAPDEQHFFDRLNMLGGVLEEPAESPRFLNDPASVPSFDGFSLGETATETSGEPKAETLEFEWNSVAEEAPAHGAVSFADLNESEEPVVGDLVSFARGPMMSDSHGSVAEIEQPGAKPVDDETEGKPATSAAGMRQELESVDFYITQGYSDIAFDTLELLERQFGSHPDIEARRKKLEAANASSEAPTIEFSVPPAGDSATKTGADTEAEDIAFGEIIVEHPGPAQTPPVTPGEGIDSGLAEIFEEFRLEAEGESAIAHEDYETHYNMATAYKEMDLLDEAIREFQVAAGLTGSADGTSRYFHCCNMLGHCFVQKGMPQAAVTWFKKGLNAPGRNAEESKALQYELGAAYEQMGDLKSAVAAFTDVYGVDISYRDIGDRLERLHAQTASKTKKGK
jgi:tetratricopeptide (TPR) repeat protein